MVLFCLFIHFNSISISFSYFLNQLNHQMAFIPSTQHKTEKNNNQRLTSEARIKIKCLLNGFVCLPLYFISLGFSFMSMKKKKTESFILYDII